MMLKNEQKIKPHIAKSVEPVFMFVLWSCAGGGVIGIGSTPEKAYRAWASMMAIAVAALCGVTVKAVYAWGEFVPIKHAALFKSKSK